MYKDSFSSYFNEFFFLSLNKNISADNFALIILFYLKIIEGND